eukprot:COSAG05_NODE_1949_length_3794_cov_5.044182_2_plen_379_part_00
MLRDVAASGAELPNWSADLTGAVTMLRTFINQVPAVIANRVNESVMDIAIEAQLNLAGSIVTLTDSIRTTSDGIQKEVRELVASSATSISASDVASEHHRATTYRSSMLQVYAAHDQYRVQADHVSSLSIDLRRAQTIRNSGKGFSAAARTQLTTVVNRIQSSLDTANSCKENFHKQIVETAFDLINMAPSERSDKTNPLLKLGSMKLRSGESSPKTASDIRSAVMAYVRMHVPELYGIMFIIIRFLETPVTLESWEPVRNYDISALQSDEKLTDEEFVDKFDQLGFHIDLRSESLDAIIDAIRAARRDADIGNSTIVERIVTDPAGEWGWTSGAKERLSAKVNVELVLRPTQSDPSSCSVPRTCPGRHSPPAVGALR